MLVLDSERQEFRQKRLVVERTRDLTDSEIARQTKHLHTLLQDDNGIDTTKTEGQIGQLLWMRTFAEKLSKINSNLFLEVNPKYPSLAGVYTLREEKKIFLVGCESTWMPEFSIRHYKEEKRYAPDGTPYLEKVFIGHKRGWREVLAILMRAGHVTQGAIEKHFPRCFRDSRTWWQATTQ